MQTLPKVALAVLLLWVLLASPPLAAQNAPATQSPSASAGSTEIPAMAGDAEIRQAEVRRLEAERRKLELEAEEIARRLETPWWQGQRLTQYLLAIVVTAALLFGWSRVYLEPILRKEGEVNKLVQDLNATRNELLEAESNRIRRDQAEIAAERDNLKAERDSLARRHGELNAIVSGLQVAVAKATDGRGEFFSILNSRDPIKRLADTYGWKVWSDNYWGQLGYYLIIEHPDVRGGEGIIVGRSFEIDALKRKSPDGWRDVVQQVVAGGRGGPVLALDYSYFALYEDETAPVGGTIYRAGGDDIEFYAPLSQWSERLGAVVSDE